jgi:hypothetical protein
MGGETNPTPFSSKKCHRAVRLDVQNIFWCNASGFLSRALAALAIQYLSGCAIVEAVVAVVDGSGDSGMDALYYSPTAHRLWIVQSKFFANAQGEPSLGDVSKFQNGLEALMQVYLNNSPTTYCERLERGICCISPVLEITNCDLQPCGKNGVAPESLCLY